jgi:hypothetical protein
MKTGKLFWWPPFRAKKSKRSVLQGKIQAADQELLDAEEAVEYHLLKAAHAEGSVGMLRRRLARLNHHLSQEK